jgi:hypothetical protein
MGIVVGAFAEATDLDIDEGCEWGRGGAQRLGLRVVRGGGCEEFVDKGVHGGSCLSCLGGDGGSALNVDHDSSGAFMTGCLHEFEGAGSVVGHAGEEVIAEASGREAQWCLTVA